ncbi:hypothetical protein L1887_51059 [Cichorium endivia]|nr:hypothetical protein L1887_51059 [Cichorium endivia]
MLRKRIPKLRKTGASGWLAGLVGAAAAAAFGAAPTRISKLAPTHAPSPKKGQSEKRECAAAAGCLAELVGLRKVEKCSPGELQGLAGVNPAEQPTPHRFRQSTHARTHARMPSTPLTSRSSCLPPSCLRPHHPRRQPPSYPAAATLMADPKRATSASRSPSRAQPNSGLTVSTRPPAADTADDHVDHHNAHQSAPSSARPRLAGRRTMSSKSDTRRLSSLFVPPTTDNAAQPHSSRLAALSKGISGALSGSASIASLREPLRLSLLRRRHL